MLFFLEKNTNNNDIFYFYLQVIVYSQQLQIDCKMMIIKREMKMSSF
jgi:hypothetical protein